MAKVRNISDQALVVVCNGHPAGGNLGTVDPDEVLEVRDDVYVAHAWSDTVWAEVEGPARSDKPAAARGKSKDEG